MFELVRALAAHAVEIVVCTGMLRPRVSTSVALAQRCPLAGNLSAIALSLQPTVHPNRMAPSDRTNVRKCTGRLEPSRLLAEDDLPVVADVADQQRSVTVVEPVLPDDSVLPEHLLKSRISD